jgi:hypothetical protein
MIDEAAKAKLYDVRRPLTVLGTSILDAAARGDRGDRQVSRLTWIARQE